jgi:Kef-type K+ transport system membrane component KefB
MLTGNLPLALLLGVLATATAPAATVDVLEEYEAEGPLTTSIVAVVGIDDALALIVFSLMVPLAESAYTSVAAPSLLEVLEVPLVEIGGSILVGAMLGVPLAIYIKRYCDSATTQIAVTVGVIFLSAGLSNSLHLSEILTTMTLGAVVVNMSKGDASCIRDTIEQAGPVLYILFFALVGARFEVLNVLLGTGTLALAGAYMLLRIAGKFTGAWVGGYLSRAEPAVRDNIGLALLSQAGVAIGLALDIGDRFSEYGWSERETWAMFTQGPGDTGLALRFADEPNGAVLGALVVTVITATTFVVQLIGPILVKFAISRAGEMWQAGQVEGAGAD